MPWGGQRKEKKGGWGHVGVPVVAQWVKNLNSIHEDAGSIPCLSWWLRIQCCHKLQRRSETLLGFHIAVAVV